MRLYPCITFLVLLLPCATLAQQSTTPNYTAADQAQFAKLRPAVGTWNCTDVPASKNADVITTSQEGNWFVSHETGDNPNTSYTRWSHDYQRFISVTMDPFGSMLVSTTTGPDPNNATWTTDWPTTMPNTSAAIPSSTVTLSGNTMVWISQTEMNGKMIPTKQTCVKAVMKR